MVQFDSTDLIYRNYTAVTMHTFLQIVIMPHEATRQRGLSDVRAIEAEGLSIHSIRGNTPTHEKLRVTELILPASRQKQITSCGRSVVYFPPIKNECIYAFSISLIRFQKHLTQDMEFSNTGGDYNLFSQLIWDSFRK